MQPYGPIPAEYQDRAILSSRNEIEGPGKDNRSGMVSHIGGLSW
jgi:hypothetical protein